MVDESAEDSENDHTRDDSLSAGGSGMRRGRCVYTAHCAVERGLHADRRVVDRQSSVEHGMGRVDEPFDSDVGMDNVK